MDETALAPGRRQAAAGSLERPFHPDEYDRRRREFEIVALIDEETSACRDFRVTGAGSAAERHDPLPASGKA